MAGVAVHTLRGLALEVLGRAGEPGLYGAELFDLWTQRVARRLPALKASLGGLVDGYSSVPGTVRDLLEAGFEPVHLPAATEALRAEVDEGRAARAAVERGVALLQVAALVSQELEREGLCTDWTLLRRASQLLEEAAKTETVEHWLPCRAVLITGFADATGVALDWMETLLRCYGGRVYLEQPPDPGRPAVAKAQDGEQLALFGTPDGTPPPEDQPTTSHETAFSARLAERWSSVLDAVEQEDDVWQQDGARQEECSAPRQASALLASALQEPALQAIVAPGPEAEVAEVVRRVRSCLEGSVSSEPVRPERVAVVVRDLTPYGRLLARHLHRLGVPFSAGPSTTHSAGSRTPAGRLARGLLELLTRGELLAVDRWLELQHGLDEAHKGRLRRALFGLGMVRLRDLRREQEEELDELGVDETPVSGEGVELLPWLERGRAVLDALEDWPAAAPLGYHLDLLLRLLRQLRWPAQEAASGEAAAVLMQSLLEAREQLPLAVPVVREELRALLSGWWEPLSRADLAEGTGVQAASWGGGVQVLSVMEARSLTFERLFVLGLGAHQFPRRVREDPLLPDSLRLALTRVLPDLAVKRRGFEEERHLFAQLLASAPEVTLSWASMDEDGRALPISPLVERLRYRPAGAPLIPQVARPLAPGGLQGSTPTSASMATSPLWDHLLAAGTSGRRNDFQRLLVPAWREGLELYPPRGNGLRAALEDAAAGPTTAWLQTLAEMAPDRSIPQGRWGPFLGLTGSGTDGDRRIHVTTLEQLAACPWQTFVQRVLRVEPPHDPLQRLPALTPPMVGRAVHAALEQLAARITPPASRRENHLAAVRQRPGWDWTWPEGAELDALLETAATETLADSGIRSAGLARALAARARPFVDEARKLDARLSPPRVQAQRAQILGAEVSGRFFLNPAPDRNARAGSTQLHFQADRVDRLPGGALRLTDYKTGKPPDLGDGRGAHHQALLKAVRRGRQLQAAVYALAASTPEQPAEGRYVYLRPADPPETGGDSEQHATSRQLSTAGIEPQLQAELPPTLHRLLRLWQAGVFFPRLVEPREDREPRRCASCAVAEACVRGDSGTRRRLLRAVEQARDAGRRPEWLDALLEVWDLPVR